MPTPPPNPALFASIRRLNAFADDAAYVPVPSMQLRSDKYDAALQHTEQQLRRLLVDEEMTIASLPPTPNPSLAAQLSAERAALAAPPYIPSPSSPLAALLATRTITSTITSTAATLPVFSAQIDSARSSLASMRALLSEQETLHAALQKRLQKPEGTDGGAEEVVRRTRVREAKNRATMKDLRAFIRTVLVPLLEIEELGGPVVGVGTAEDGEKIIRKGRGQSTLEEAFQRSRRKSGRIEDEEAAEEVDVGKEMETLLQQLMRKSLEVDSYVRCERESAAVRFLVRARVAELKSGDAAWVRLVDFGARLDDSAEQAQEEQEEDEN